MATAVIPQQLVATEVAAALRCKESRVYRLIREGRLRATRNGRRWLIAADDFKAFIETGAPHAGDTAAPPAESDTPALPAAVAVDPDWLAATLAKFTPDDLRRAAELLLALASGQDKAGAA